LALPIKEKQPFYGIKKQENQFIKQLFGRIEELQIFVKNTERIKESV